MPLHRAPTAALSVSLWVAGALLASGCGPRAKPAATTPVVTDPAAPPDRAPRTADDPAAKTQPDPATTSATAPADPGDDGWSDPCAEP